MRTWLLAVLIIAFSSLGCSRAPQQRPDILLDCSSTAGREILKISPGALKVQHLTLTPTRSGQAKLTDGEYALEFSDLPIFKLRFRINRYTGEGTRELVDEAGKVAPRDSILVLCKPYEGKPL